MLYLFFRGRYGPILRAVAGIAIVIYGIADSATAAVIVGGVLIVWAIATGFSQLRPGSGSGATGSGVGPMTAIVLEHVTKRFGEFAAVDDVSFEVPEGQLLAVLGPNGAGKTTTLEMLEGFLAPTSGTVRVLGADPRHGGRAWRARVGLVLQSTSLDPELDRPRHPQPLRAALPPAMEGRRGAGAGRPDRRCPDARRGAVGRTALAGSISPSASSADPTSCSSTSRPRALTPRPAGGPGPLSRTSPRREPPSCSPPTTSTRPTTSPTG